jgi:hypothetical protein
MIRKRKKNDGKPQQKRPEGWNRWMLGYAYTPSSILQALYLAMAVTFFIRRVCKRLYIFFASAKRHLSV